MKLFTLASLLFLSIASANDLNEAESSLKSASLERISYTNFTLGYAYNNADATLDVYVPGYDIYGSGTLNSSGVQLGYESALAIPGEKPFDNFYFSLNGSWNSANVSGTLSVYDSSFGSYSLSGDVTFDYYALAVGSGYYIPLNDNVHLVTEVGVDYNRLDLNIYDTDLSTDDVGFYAMPHIRAKNGQMEFHTGFKFTTNVLSQSSQNYFIRAIYAVNPVLDLFASGYLGLNDERGALSFYNQFGFQAGIRIKY